MTGFLQGVLLATAVGWLAFASYRAADKQRLARITAAYDSFAAASLEMRAAEQGIRYAPVTKELIRQLNGEWSAPVRHRFEHNPDHPLLINIGLQRVDVDAEYLSRRVRAATVMQ